MRSGSANFTLRALCALALTVALPATARVDGTRLQATVETLAGYGSRIPGTPGHLQAGRLIEQRFKAAGLTDFSVQRFRVPVPESATAQLTVGGREYEVETLSPNSIRLSALPAGGVTGPLLYAGSGQLNELEGMPVDGAIILVDFACGQRWLDLACLGAEAVVFLEPAMMDRGEARRKFISVPLDVPRFYLGRDSFEALRDEAGALPGRPFQLPAAQLAANSDWRFAEGRNLFGFCEGSDPELKQELVVISAYYDSISVVPRLAPGAEQAGGLATLLELADSLQRQPPRRSVLLVALDAHFEALAGARHLADLLRRDQTRDRWDKAREIMRREDDERLERLQGLLAGPRDHRLTEAEDEVYRTELAWQLDTLKGELALQDRIHGNHELLLNIALDLSSGGDRVGVFHAGHFYGNDKLTRFLSPLGRRLESYSEGTELSGVVHDCITPAQDQAWDSWVPDQFATDAEPLVQAARPAVSLFTVDDARPLVDTPFDTPDQVRFEVLTRQAEAVVATLQAMLDDPELKTVALKRIRRLPYQYEPVEGMVYEFERRKTFLPSTPVPGSLVAVRDTVNAMMGVRPDILTMADTRGDFRIVGYPYEPALKIDAYGIKPGSGAIDYAPDLGPEGELKYPREAMGRQGLRRPLIIFPCRALHLFDLVDERYFETLEQIFVYDARTDSEPRSYGFEKPIASPPAKLAGTVSASYVEPVAVVYAPRDPTGAFPDTRVKVTMGMGLLGLRLVLTHATPEDPEGSGFDPKERNRIVRTPYQTAHDMWVIDDQRMTTQKKFGIDSKRLNELHEKAKVCLDAATGAMQDQDWSRHMAQAREAWAYEGRAYPDVQGTEADTIRGVLFYLALLLPFAFFTERLLVGSPRIHQQIGWTIAVFLIVYIALRLVHPAFQLLDTPWIILLGFIIMTLAMVVIGIVARRFNEELDALQVATGGQHSADVSRMSTLGAAFGLGISNMRRRPLRTALTATTLTLLTFTVLSFTSVQTSLKANARPTSGHPTYGGILVRDPVWSALEEPMAAILENQFRQDGLVAPRAWLTSAQLDKQMKLAIRNGTTAWAREQAATMMGAAWRQQMAFLLKQAPPADAGEPLLINAVLGVTPQEPQISGLGSKLLAGRWFQPGDKNVCILPTSVAKKLDLGPGSSAAQQGLGFGALEVFGSRLPVIGVVEDARLTDVVDLDGESLTPVDFSQLAPEKLKLLQEQQAQKLKLGGAAPPPIDRYEHFVPETFVILPYQRLMAIGGTLRSVAVRFHDPAAVPDAARALMDRFELSAYATEDQQVYLYSSVGVTSVSGLDTVLIPLLIAALIVLNTMLGSVAERLSEIGIFSSIGLAPMHIATLFLAESCVFANIGVIIGYLGGQTLAKGIFWAQHHGWLSSLAGLSLNYSSTAAVGVATIIIATVLLSTLYPARKAARMATPDVERRWRLPQPDGHRMSFRLPFMLTGRDGVACNLFLKEYFDGYVDFPGGDFYTNGTTFEQLHDERGAYRLALTVWLAPYDLGVSQEVELFTRPDPDDPHVNAVDIQITRVSGDDNGWRRTNWLFINILRQQFLIWRTIAPGQKSAYAEQGLAFLSGPDEGGT